MTPEENEEFERLASERMRLHAETRIHTIAVFNAWVKLLELGHVEAVINELRNSIEFYKEQLAKY